MSDDIGELIYQSYNEIFKINDPVDFKSLSEEVKEQWRELSRQAYRDFKFANTLD